jgi:phenylpyruvate tautomerase PptA (4-oxalocrotonate tautomerase family)
MPVTRVAIRKGKSAAYKQAILDGIYAAQLEAVHISEGDRFMALSEHEASEFAYGANFLGIGRTDELVQIQVFWAPGKGADTKKAMYRKIVENLGRSPGVRAEDIMISVFEAPAENWSFGNGEAQFFKG